MDSHGNEHLLKNFPFISTTLTRNFNFWEKKQPFSIKGAVYKDNRIFILKNEISENEKRRGENKFNGSEYTHHCFLSVFLEY